MTAPSSIDPTRFLHEQLAQASPDLLRHMLTTFINTLMSAEADAVCGAPYGQVRTAVKYTAIADWAADKEYSVTFICDQLGVARQGYYRWLADGPRQREPF
jgi:hypothetical protein